MKWTIALVVMTVLVMPLAAAAGNATAGVKCADVAFTPRSDDTAAHIRATGVGCRTARKLVRDSEGRPGRRFRAWTCTRKRVRSEGLPYRRFRCVDGDAAVTWRRY